MTTHVPLQREKNIYGKYFDRRAYCVSHVCTLKYIPGTIPGYRFRALLDIGLRVGDEDWANIGKDLHEHGPQGLCQVIN